MEKAILMDSRDNVATALADLPAEEIITLEIGSTTHTIKLTQAIPFGHKFAIKDIPQGAFVLKYGEVIGQATQEIKAGDYVHTHNIQSLRGRGELR